MKVNKEELLAMMVAVEVFLDKDHKAEWREWERRIKVIASAVSSIPSVKTEVRVPEIANHVPHLYIRWDENAVKINVPEVARRLREGEPAIEVVPGSKEDLGIGVWMLARGEEKIVARRIREALKSAS